MKIVLIRHGMTKGNRERRYVGRTDESLCMEGITETKDKNPIPVEILITSPMKRCIETANILYPSMDYEIYEDLKECDFGNFEYRNYEELKDNESYKRWVDSGGLLAFPNGESREEFMERTMVSFHQAIEDIIKRSINHVAFVVHGGTIMSILHNYSCPNKEYFNWQISNSCGYITEINEKMWMNGLKEMKLRGKI